MDNGPDHFCPGCTMFTDDVLTALTHFARRDTAWTTVWPQHPAYG